MADMTAERKLKLRDETEANPRARRFYQVTSSGAELVLGLDCFPVALFVSRKMKKKKPQKVQLKLAKPMTSD